MVKLKEKLAEEYVGKSFPYDSVREDKLDCYLAAFEKAREMVCEIEWNAAGNSEQLEKFKNLGEEEV